ncbi:MAG TPA: maleylpyruvate isomerase N-terminal domain-containing protein, partial [Candidatus Dormibacteraeota bacterium]
EPLRDGPGQSLAAAYEETRATILGILVDLDGRQLLTVIPACPAWTARDLVGHLTGVAGDTLGGRFPAINPHGTWAERQAVVDAHTAGQVTSRRAMRMDEVLDEWAGHLPRLLAMLRGDEALPAGSMPAHDWVIVSDIAAHAQDLRGTFHVPGDRDSAGVALGLRRYATGAGQRLDRAGLPGLRLCAEGREDVVGTGSPAASVTASRWELFRALGSRRSMSQLRALRWVGDPEPYVALLPVYGPRIADLIE